MLTGKISACLVKYAITKFFSLAVVRSRDNYCLNLNPLIESCNRYLLITISDVVTARVGEIVCGLLAFLLINSRESTEASRDYTRF